ncbi:MAG: radical SAM protein [Alphaproteobacteria bacterium]|nr:radical SAM protein [Alphaproteobacteria bacterium]
MPKVNGYIERKSMLYKTGVEYGDYTMNHAIGCSHGCKYPCYAFLMARRFGKAANYEEWIKPILVTNTLELLDKEIPKMKDNIKSVHLCFTTDPFMYGYEEIKKMSLAAIKKLNEAGIKCTVLTKGILPKDLSKLSKKNEYGITLVSLNDKYRKDIEPGSAPYKSRIAALKALHDAGFKTWVSIEPYPTPNLVEQDLDEILEILAFTDKIIFGRTNYNSEVSAYKQHKAFYNEQARKVIEFCKKRKIDYHIKNGTITEA